uniref:Tryptophan synthase beta chain-like PALP domain-containing protein n=1 Tax=Globisporangium ultimum (strain ATCC 200006 / CBS 805.95 / DAOM BR144) TaxID=431595 RepID=K3WQE0_GLOUD
MLKSVPFVAPKWAASLRNPPAKKLRLGHFPTPIFPFAPPGLPDGVKMYIKRDDFSGLETSGNKIRKLEFLMSDALDQGADCVVTCGGVQSNHCRATATVARMLGLDSYLLLRTNKPDEDPKLVGNLLFDRMVDATLIQMSRQEYGKYGSEAMISRTCERLEAENRRPYAIPVGGSNGLGSWGYIEAIDELHKQLQEQELEVTDLAFACGSGGTAAGISLGSYLYAKSHPSETINFDNKVPVHAYIVCDNEEYFYNYIDKRILPEMGAPSELSSREFMQITNSQGTGYARSTKAELEFITNVARTTGVLMDPVYSGKALYHLIRELNENPSKFSGKTILFIHTGGQFGLFDKDDDLQDVVNRDDQVQRFRMDD